MKYKLREILIVDDDQVMRMLTVRSLMNLGFEQPIYSFRNGWEGMEFIKNRIKPGTAGFPILILLDIEMPVMNGWEFLEAFEALDEHVRRHYRIIVVTSSTIQPENTRFLRPGCVEEFLAKPLTPELILDVFSKKNFLRKMAS